MISRDCFIVYQNTQSGPYPVMVELSQQLAYEYISAASQGKPVQNNEWSIFKTKIHMIEDDRAIPGKLSVIIPKHVLE
jgi:hypothetical protein